MDDGYDDTEGGHTYGMLQTCKRHDCAFKHPSRRLLCRCILCHSDVGDCGNTLYLLYWIHPLTRKREVDYARFLHGVRKVFTKRDFFTAKGFCAINL